MEPVPLNPDETEHAVRLWNELPQRLEQLFSKVQPEISDSGSALRDEFQAALDAINRALLTTRNYLAYRDGGGERDSDREDDLSMLWSQAGIAIQPYDPEFANLCWVKGHGWADQRVWTNEKYKNLPVQIDQMLDRLLIVSKERPPRAGDKPNKIEQWFAYGFGLTFITVIVIIALFYPHPSPFQYTVFRIVLALAAAGVAAVLPGLLHFEPNKTFRAGGALAVFLIIFFFSPAALVSEPPAQSPIPTASPVQNK